MIDTIVPYARFLEIRHRRQRVQAELALTPILDAPRPPDDSVEPPPLIVECQLVTDQQCGTLSADAAEALTISRGVDRCRKF